MLVIRFLRVGKKNQPSFKIVVVDKRKSSKSGSFLEEVGFYNPLTKEKVLKGDRIKYWISVGVQPSPTVYNLLIKEKILEGKKIPVHKKPKKKEAAPEGGEPRPESSGREKPEEKKPAPEAKPETKTPVSAGSASVAKAISAKEAASTGKEEKPAEKIETKKETKAQEKGKPEEKKPEGK